MGQRKHERQHVHVLHISCLCEVLLKLLVNKHRRLVRQSQGHWRGTLKIFYIKVSLLYLLWLNVEQESTKITLMRSSGLGLEMCAGIGCIVGNVGFSVFRTWPMLRTKTQNVSTLVASIKTWRDSCVTLSWSKTLVLTEISQQVLQQILLTLIVWFFLGLLW